MDPKSSPNNLVLDKENNKAFRMSQILIDLMSYVNLNNLVLLI